MCNRARYALFFSRMPKRKKKQPVSDRYRGVVSLALQVLVARLLVKLPFSEVANLLSSTAEEVQENERGVVDTPQLHLDCAGVLIEDLADVIEVVANDA